jgi:hypothetical protein
MILCFINFNYSNTVPTTENVVQGSANNLLKYVRLPQDILSLKLPYKRYNKSPHWLSRRRTSVHANLSDPKVDINIFRLFTSNCKIELVAMKLP